jgi:dephospho-CoA kinase
MLKSKKIAVTGGLAAGKTSVCRILQELGAYTISADEIVHQLLSPHSELGKQIVEIFGQSIITNAAFDRKKIAEHVFADPKKLQKLEHLLHPAVLKTIQQTYQNVLTHTPPPLFVAEIPLLFEISAEEWFDTIVVVTAPESLAKERFKTASGYPDEQFLLRSQRQMPVEEKIRKADYIIYNDGSISHLKTQVKTLFQMLITK